LFSLSLERSYALFQRWELAANFVNLALQLIVVLRELFTDLVEMILKFLGLLHGVSQVALSIFGRFPRGNNVILELSVFRLKTSIFVCS
jgi:hypothetical protein